MNKSIFQQLKTGIIKGWKTPTLPEYLINLLNNPLIRIFRFLGGISYLIILGKSYIPTIFPIYIIAFIIAIFFLLFHIYITYHRIKHIRYLFKTGQLDIRNSPLQRLATLTGKALMCLKGACDSAQPIGLTLGLMLGTDEILKNANREPLFGPFLGSALNAVFPADKKNSLTQLVGKSFEEIVSEGKIIKEIKEFQGNLDNLDKTGGISKSEYNELSKSFKDIINNSSERQIELSNEIKKIVEDKTKN